jgi:hypothetical protein
VFDSVFGEIRVISTPKGVQQAARAVEGRVAGAAASALGGTQPHPARTARAVEDRAGLRRTRQDDEERQHEVDEVDAQATVVSSTLNSRTSRAAPA